MFTYISSLLKIVVIQLERINSNTSREGKGFSSNNNAIDTDVTMSTNEYVHISVVAVQVAK